MAPEDLLLAARDVMRERGLARHALEDDDGSVCLLGAVNTAESGNAYRSLQDLVAFEALMRVCGDRFGAGIAAANNEHVATLDEACDVLEAAAKRAAQGGEAR